MRPFALRAIPCRSLPDPCLSFAIEFLISDIIHELKYLNLEIFKSLLLSEPCCQQRYYQSRELLGIDRIEKVEEPEFFRPGTLGKIQKCLWDLFEKPHTSLGARVSGPRATCPGPRVTAECLDRGHHLHQLHRHQHRRPHAQHPPVLSGETKKTL